ncbi:MAG: transglutaminase-like cysteine peptidase [Pseudolabrys sp.]
MIRIEAEMIALCRSQPQTCSPAAAKFIGIIETARTRSGRARAGEVNRAVNLAIRPLSDQAQFGVPDFWASPLVTFASGAGDCEDYAIAKYVALREAGMAASDSRLIVLRDRREPGNHAGAAARVDGQWLMLDNRRMIMMTDVDANVSALYALGDDEENLAPVFASAGQPDA